MVSCRCWRAFFSAFLLFFVAFSLINAAINNSDNKSNVGVTELLDVLEKLLLFFKKNYQNVNLDAVFGLRTIEGQCKLLVEEYERGELEFVSSSLMKRVGQIAVDAGKLGNMAIPHVHESDHKYLVLLKNFVAAPWKVFHPHRVVNPSLRWNVHQYSPPDFGEEDSDGCLGELTRTPKRPSCQLSENCLLRMFSSGQTGYHLQHQILYTILAQKVGCEREVNDYLVARTHFKDLDQVQHEFCTNAYYELEEATVASGRRIEPNYRDLFLEIESVCPSLGYFQFMRKEWLEAIVTWQSDDGCFPKVPSVPTLDVPSNDRVQGIESVVAPINLFEQVPVYHRAIQPSMDGNYRSNGVRGYLDDGITDGRIRAHVPVHNEPIQPQKQVQFGLNVPWTNDIAYASPYNARATHPPVIQYHFAPVADEYPRSQGSLNVLQNHYDIPYKINRGLKSLDHDLDEHFVSNRRLLREKELPGGCLAHFTSVASSALVMYLRYLIDPGPPEFMHLRMENYLRGTSRSDSSKPSVVVNEVSSIGKMHYGVHVRTDIPAGLPTAIPALKSPDKLAPDFDDMRTEAFKFMGTYQRQWGPRFQSIQAPDNREASNRLPDHVHVAEVHKELSDWTVVPVTTVTTTTTSVSIEGGRYRDVISTLPNWLRYKGSRPKEVSNTESTLDSVLRANLVEGGQQIDLDHYLIIIVFISLACLFVFYRYYRQKRHSKCKARHL